MKSRKTIASYLLLTSLLMFLTVGLVQVAYDQFNPPSSTVLKRVHRSTSAQNVEIQPFPYETNCTPAAIEQFPKPMFNLEYRLKGAITANIIGALYFFLGLAIVCDEYFVPSLECICKALNMKADVAGATLMAAGSSAPELATAVIAVFVTEDDIGVSAVVGSAVYNVAFVVAICGLFSGKTIYLNWWPMVRDCFFYVVSICALLYVMQSGSVSWIKSLVFLILYAGYIAFMFINERIENRLDRISGLNCLKPWAVVEQTQLVLFRDTSLNGLTYTKEIKSADLTERECLNKQTNDTRDDAEESSIFEVPDTKSKMALWVLSLPLLMLCYVTIPDCRRTRWKKWFFATFLMSCVWISALSYVLVWMITIIGYTFGVPDTVMGLTFLAAGVSVPDAVASLIVAKDGEGDMAISNAIGSNVFDILLCLGLPWFLQTAIIHPGSIVPIVSKGMTYTTICLLSTVLFLLVSIHCNGWKLNKRFGFLMLIWYIAFMVLAGMYEGNVFGNINLPMCFSDF